ncbi:cytochrome P450 [Peniophora sp. CONT]|nr:cytochrome P450 [Peniophora sp. CONT]
MSATVICLVTLLCAVITLRVLEERGLKCIGIAPYQVHFPGPTALPFFGNLLELRKGHARTLARWADAFGPIIRIVIGDREAVILNTYDAVQRTLISQGQAFQSRPETREYHGFFAAVAGLHNAPTTLGTSPWSSHISMHRKNLGLQVTGNKHRQYDHFLTRRLHDFITLLASDAKKGPRDLGYATWTTTMGLAVDMCFGTHISEADARALAYAEIEIFRGPRSIGQPLHAVVPFLDFAQKMLRPAHGLLNALGLAGFLDEIIRSEDAARALRATEIGYASRLKDDLHARVRAGDTTPSQLGDILRSVDGSFTTADENKVALSLISTGTGVGTVLLWLTGLLASRPDFQNTAHEAIQREYEGATPDPLDTGRVEYISALGTEASRYFASLVLGFPRATTEDAEVDGVRIPAGTMVMHNTFSVNRDPARYDRPDEFLPERWCDGHYGRVGQKDVRVGVPHMNNGVGRRQCLGLPYVNKALYSTLILMLHFFKLERAELDTEGRKEVFPAFRACGADASAAMDPVEDQAAECAAQAIPRATGVRLVPRDLKQLAHWLEEGYEIMGQSERSGGNEEPARAAC